MQLAAFAHEIETFDTLEQYEEEQSKQAHAEDIKERNTSKTGLAMSSQCFSLCAPMGVGKSCHALFSGHVIQTERRVNEKTGEPFYWVLVRTLFDMEVDVVVDPKCLKFYRCHPPKVGGVLTGYFWLSGRIMCVQ